MAITCKVGAFLYGNSLESGGGNIAADWARASDGTFDEIVLSWGGYSGASENGGISAAQLKAIEAISHKYFNIWASSSFSRPTCWQPAPSDVGDPDITLQDGCVHCFRMTNRHIRRFCGHIEDAVIRSTNPCLGAFLDDWGYGRKYWKGPAGEARDHANTIAQKKLLWAAHDGLDGYVPEGDGGDEYDWNSTRADEVRDYLLGLAQSCGKSFIFNGANPSEPTLIPTTLREGQPRLWEGYQRNYSRAYIREHARAGDWILVLARDIADGAYTWYEVQAGDSETDSGADINPGLAAGTSYYDIMQQAIADATELGLVLAVSGSPNDSSDFYGGAAKQTGATAPHSTTLANLEDPADWEAE